MTRLRAERQPGMASARVISFDESAGPSVAGQYLHGRDQLGVDHRSPPCARRTADCCSCGRGASPGHAYRHHSVLAVGTPRGRSGPSGRASWPDNSRNGPRRPQSWPAAVPGDGRLSLDGRPGADSRTPPRETFTIPPPGGVPHRAPPQDIRRVQRHPHLTR